ncbi:MAG: CDP-diacylglycerol--glycerol-3-phosphate 3-phosphatidyltransferase [Christensenellaceae bacterium]|jgi:CDP-diacylglycerol--glycerol-3-phosphate 3-phosphatidyltransferase|nr:CDP-diacylglycerol--glycerol-3-phosphate 3-phosphatidyltransferase [Christensenellaceae bacterium]
MFKLWKKVNLPTKITLIRMAMLPFIMLFYIAGVCLDVTFFTNWGKLIATILFVIAVGTDWLDGYIARKYNMVTNTGKLLDPVADKMLTMLGFILILADPIWYETWDRTMMMPSVPAFPFWFAVITVFVAFGRETITNSLRFIAAEKGIVIAADKLGKAKSLFQFIAITLYMLLAFNLNPFIQFVQDDTMWLDLWSYTCVFMMTAAAVLTVWSCVNYIQNYVKEVNAKGAGGDSGAVTKVAGGDAGAVNAKAVSTTKEESPNGKK